MGTKAFYTDEEFAARLRQLSGRGNACKEAITSGNFGILGAPAGNRIPTSDWSSGSH